MGGHAIKFLHCFMHVFNPSLMLLFFKNFFNGKAGDSVQLLHLDVTEEKWGGKICVVNVL